LFGGILHRRPAGFPAHAGADMDVTAIMSGQERRVTSSAFKGGRVTAVMGGAEIDLTGAALDGGKATVELTAIMGAIEITVPRDWKVVLDGTPILGSVTDARRSVADAEAKSTLYVKATAIMGGVEIKG
jgi:predicted membrane protein